MRLTIINDKFVISREDEENHLESREFIWVRQQVPVEGITKSDGIFEMAFWLAGHVRAAFFLAGIRSDYCRTGKKGRAGQRRGTDEAYPREKVPCLPQGDGGRLGDRRGSC